MIKEYDSYPLFSVDNFTYKLTEKEFSTNPYLKILTYVEKDKIIGFLLYSLIYDRIEIEQFEVTTKERRKGIGNKLLNYLVEKYQDNNIKNITLEVKEDNIAAINLYKKYGFKKVSTREKYYDGINGILMEKTL
ncbi:MAG TPA: ribosomal protein S18-alanine N-acetyltransferase [Candidatus Onthousia excrementipullorum]|uniref:[Ribosomal protein bS18]-alanine N-acetyltransferase n=1 Tax=Candidatus Onthousia excrementipullorum TaxID=2840884 RepID=A0A9D1DV07_9FIRM|nr:ribosomal protein S18-alanine N-acetyltransferase [Candidatus Onthousia excrementipullorum]